MLIPTQEILDRCEGRLNPRGIGILYVTNSPEVAIKEIRATFNDKVVVAKGNLTRKIDVIDLSNIINLSPFNMLGTSIAPIYQLNKLDLQKIVEDLEQSVQGKRRRLEYIPTQFISSLIQTQFDGIKYRSTMVKDSKEYNLALFNKDFVDFSLDEFEYKTITSVDYRIV